jgi:hypothetical protein
VPLKQCCVALCSAAPTSAVRAMDPTERRRVEHPRRRATAPAAAGAGTSRCCSRG